VYQHAVQYIDKNADDRATLTNDVESSDTADERDDSSCRKRKSTSGIMYTGMYTGKARLNAAMRNDSDEA
jgi:hypothetical protein